MKNRPLNVAVTETASPAALTKNRPANVAVTETASPAALTKNRPANVAVTEASPASAVTKHKPKQTAKAVPHKQEVCHKNGTQKDRSQGKNANSVTGKISSS
jgi:hypothetical protein